MNRSLKNPGAKANRPPPVQCGVVVLAVIMICGCSHPAPKPQTATEDSEPLAADGPSVSEIAAHYTNFVRVTKHLVFVNPELAMLCRGASQAEVEAARATNGPHAHTAALIYMNAVAADSFGREAAPYPVGSVIVKQKLQLPYWSEDGNQVYSGEPAAGGMIKRGPGYDPEHGDWEYFYFEDKSKIESGVIESCVKCHSAVKDRDYVFGTWNKDGE